MSNAHAPYIMPDGKHLSHYLRTEEPHEADARTRLRKKNTRSKDDMWLQLQRNKKIASNGDELQEIGAIEKAGQRRRRRWLNDKVLRDMAGPMSAADMQSQFTPVPFGSYPPPSAFVVAMAPEHQPLWEHFRNIDMDKQSKVLQQANVQSILELEMQILQLIDQEDHDAELVLQLPDSFARLLTHGLAQYHSLLSATRAPCSISALEPAGPAASRG
eukprot:gene13313-13442_t